MTPPIATAAVTTENLYASTVNCPHCGCPRDVEPDYHDEVDCEYCGEQYVARGMMFG